MPSASWAAHRCCIRRWKAWAMPPNRNSRARRICKVRGPGLRCWCSGPVWPGCWRRSNCAKPATRSKSSNITIVPAAGTGHFMVATPTPNWAVPFSRSALPKAITSTPGRGAFRITTAPSCIIARLSGWRWNPSCSSIIRHWCIIPRRLVANPSATANSRRIGTAMSPNCSPRRSTTRASIRNCAPKTATA